jgi:hypothetical protein
MVGVAGSTAIGAFPSRAEAEHAIDSLLGAGFGSGQVGLVLPDDEDPAAEPSGGAGSVAAWAGARFRSSIAAEITDEEIRYYEGALTAGRPLVVVRAADRFPAALEILYRCGGTYMAAFSPADAE